MTPWNLILKILLTIDVINAISVVPRPKTTYWVFSKIWTISIKCWEDWEIIKSPQNDGGVKKLRLEILLIPPPLFFDRLTGFLDNRLTG